MGIFAFWSGAGEDVRFEYGDTTRIIYIYNWYNSSVSWCSKLGVNWSKWPTCYIKWKHNWHCHRRALYTSLCPAIMPISTIFRFPSLIEYLRIKHRRKPSLDFHLWASPNMISMVFSMYPDPRNLVDIFFILFLIFLPWLTLNFSFMVCSWMIVSEPRCERWSMMAEQGLPISVLAP